MQYCTCIAVQFAIWGKKKSICETELVRTCWLKYGRGPQYYYVQCAKFYDFFFLQRKVKATIKMFRSVGVTDIPDRWLQIVRDHPWRNGNRMCHKKSSNASKKNWIWIENGKSSVLQSFTLELLFLVQSQTLFLSLISQLLFLFKGAFPTLVSLSEDENGKAIFPCDIFCLKSPPFSTFPAPHSVYLLLCQFWRSAHILWCCLQSLVMLSLPFLQHSLIFFFACS